MDQNIRVSSALQIVLEDFDTSEVSMAFWFSVAMEIFNSY